MKKQGAEAWTEGLGWTPSSGVSQSVQPKQHAPDSLRFCPKNSGGKANGDDIPTSVSLFHTCTLWFTLPTSTHPANKNMSIAQMVDK